MTVGPEWKEILLFSLPIMAGQFLQQLYNTVDTIVVGQYVGTSALAAVGTTGTLINLLVGFFVGVASGASVVISQYYGARDFKTCRALFALQVVIGLAASLCVGLWLALWPESVMRIFVNDPRTISLGMEYLSIIWLSYLPLAVSNVCIFSLRSIGENRMSMLVSLAAMGVNALCNYALIFGRLGMPALGVRGAALATILSQAVSCAWVVRFLCSEKSTLRLRAKNLLPDMRLLLPCLALGLSPFLMQITENLVAVSFNVTLLRFAGDTAVGAVTVLTTTMSLCMQLLHGLTQGAQPIMSFNYGAGNGQRVRETFRILFISCLTGSMLVWAVCMLFPGAVAGMFTPDAELSSYTAWAMRIYMAASGIFGIQIACQQSFVALGQAKAAIFLALLRKVILLIPLILLLPRLGIFKNAAFAVFFAEPVADTLAVCTTAAMFFTRFGKLTAGAENA